MAKRITQWKHVSSALILKDQSVLVCKRLPPCPFEGFWEFPGGKQEPGETAFQALKRELFEEVGVIIQKASLILTIRHVYPHINVHLSIYKVINYQGIPTGKEGQNLVWQPIDRLHQLELLPANTIIINYLKQLITIS
jgi:8-oxo-dGTP diphosphatase